MLRDRLDKEEHALRTSVERGEWRSVPFNKKTQGRYVASARQTLRKNRRINIRLPQQDLEALQAKALHEGLPYQTLVASVLHKYATGRLRAA